MFIIIFYVGIRDVVIIVSSQEETDTACTDLSCFVSYPGFFLLAMLLLDISHFGNSLQYGQSKDLVYFFFFFNA